MTSMVVALELSRIIGEIVHSFHSSWTIQHCSKFMDTLALSFHHARCFNLDLSFRRKLMAKKFMTFPDNPRRPPHLIEQEIQSGAQLVIFCLRLYTGENSDKITSKKAREQLARPWIEK